MTAVFDRFVLKGMFAWTPREYVKVFKTGDGAVMNTFILGAISELRRENPPARNGRRLFNLLLSGIAK